MSTNAKISAFGNISQDDYTWYFEDFDNDGILNIDDPKIAGPGSTQTFEEVKLSDELKELIIIRDSYKSFMKEIMERLKKMGGSQGKVKGRVKTPISMINKLRRKRLVAPIKTAKPGEKFTQGLTDIAGTMLIVQDNTQVEQVKDQILSGEIGKVFEHEDFYTKPLNGYRAHHFIVEKDGLLAEVQLKTARQSAIAGASHTPYKNGNLNAYEMNRLTELANRADAGDQKAATTVDQILSDERAAELLLTARTNPEKNVTAKQREQLNQLFDGYWEAPTNTRKNDRNQDTGLATRQQQLNELIALFSLAKSKGKIKAEAIPAIEAAMSNLAQMVGMEYESSTEKSKELWEMTREEFAEHNWQNRVKNIEKNIAEYGEDDADVKANMKSLLQKTIENKDSIKKQILSEGEGHKGYLQRMLTDGKAVPPNVLAEYPELKDEKINIRTKTSTASRTLTDISLTDKSPIIMTKGQRKKANEAALAVLDKNDLEITDDDLETLRKFTGAGGIGYVSETYEAGLLNEHYTSYPVIETIWKLLQKMGVKHGNFLEPGSGIGNFAGFKPAGVNMIMVEKSPLSSRISKLLYPNQETIHANFAQIDLSQYNITGAIGNVPFGNLNITPEKDKFNFLKPTIHNYFFLKSIDAAQPGSPIALITSVGLMDSKDSRVREELSRMARFITAFRLPADTFKDNASTSVTTDLIIFQKYPTGIEPVMDEDFITTVPTSIEKNGEEYASQHSKFYEQNPNHVLGRHKQGYGQQFLGQWGVAGKFDKAAMDAILHANLSFPYDLPADKPVFANDQGVRLPLTREYHSGSIVYYEGKFYEKERITFTRATVPQAHAKKIQSACELLDDYADFVSALAKNLEDTETKRTRFRRKMDDHIDKHGLPEEDKTLKDILRYDPRLYKLTAFVKRDPDTKELKYADVFEMQSMYQNAYNPTLSDSSDLGEITMYLLAKGSDLSIEDYESLYQGGTAEPGETLKAIADHPDFFYNPENEKYEYKYIYLSGNVRTKRDKAIAADLDKNIQAIEKVMQKELTVYDFNINPRAIHTYLPLIAVTYFLNHSLGSNYNAASITHEYSNGIGSKTVDIKVSSYYKYVDERKGFEGASYSRLLKLYIQGNPFPLRYIDSEGNTVTEEVAKKLNTVEKSKELQRLNTQKMNSMIERDFMNYLRVDASDKLRTMVEKVYNDYFTNNINPRFDGSTFRVKGMSNTFYGVKDFTVYRHNLMVAEKLAWNMRGGNCHDVGAGKTLASILLSQNLKQRGLAKKQLFVVPGKVIEKWQEEYLMLFPDAKVLNLRLAGQKKDKELVLAQLYDWDAIFIPTHAFTRIPLSPSIRIEMANERIREFREMLSDYGENLDSSEKRTVKQIEKMIEEFEKTVFDLSNTKRETDVYFDEMGIDSIFIDEAHFYKNAISTGKAFELGIAGKFSQRAEDMLQKCNYLRAVQGERNIFVLTATPVVNSPIEIYHMMKLCAPSVLDKRGLANLDDFIDTFIDTDIVFQKSASGQFIQKQIVSGYRNIPELQQLIDSVMDIKSYDQLQQFYIDFPEYFIKPNGEKKLIQPFKRPSYDMLSEMVQPSRIHELLFEDIQHRANDILEIMKKGEIPVDNFLVITSDGSNLATDLRLYDTTFEGFDDDESLKIKRLAQRVIEEYSETGIAQKTSVGNIAGPSDELNIAATRTNPSEIYSDLRENPFAYADDIYGDFFWTERAVRKNPPTPVFRNQIIFAEAVNRKNNESFHKEIKRHLVKKGIPEQEICIINGSIIGTKKTKTGWTDVIVPSGADREEYKQAASDDFNQGRYRIIIGNQTIAEGMNLNRWTTAIHHLDVPYTPAQIQQRNGRGVRQGNKHGHVNVYHYLMKDSFDQYRLQLVVKKQNWIDKLFYGDIRDVKEEITGGALGYEQMMAATASDPRIVEYMEGSHRLKSIGVEIEQSERINESAKAAAEKAHREHNEIESNLERIIKADKAMMEATMPSAGTISIQYPDSTYTSDAGIKEWMPRIAVSSYREFAFNDRFRDREVLLSQKLNKTNFNAGNIVLTVNNPSTSVYDNGILLEHYRIRSAMRLYDLMDFDNVQGVSAIIRKSGNLEEVQGLVVGTLEEFFVAQKITEPMETAKTWLKERGLPTNDYIPWLKEIEADDMQRWVSIIEPRLKELFHNAEAMFKKQAKSRIASYDKTIADAKAAFDERSKVATNAQTLLNRLQAEEVELTKKVTDLRGIVNNLMQTEFPSRSQLYNHLNEVVLPGYGIDGKLAMRMTGTKQYKTDSETGKRYTVRKNPSVKFRGALAYLGKALKIETDQYMLEGEDYMFCDATGNTLYIVPSHRVKKATISVDDAKAEAMHELFKHYEADGNDFAITLPDESPQHYGVAEKIWYKSDKIMQPGDRKGKMNHYVHDFDSGKRKVSKWDDILIIHNLKIDGRGILN